MIEFNYLAGLRGICLVLLALVLVLFTIRYVRAFKLISSAQRLYIGAMLFFILTLAWDTVNYVLAEAPFNLRILPLMLGLVLCFAYLMEPRKAMAQRFGTEVYQEDGMRLSSEEQRLYVENLELRDKIYELIQRENGLTLKVLDLQARAENDRKVREG